MTASSLNVIPIPGIVRVDTLKILGVTINDKLSMSHHVDNVCQSAAQSLYAIRLLKSKGMNLESVFTVCQATVVSRLLYAVPAWWGFTKAEDKDKLQAVLNRAKRWGYYKANDPNIAELCSKREDQLFKNVLSNPHHVLHQFLPPVKTFSYNLRKRGHNRELPTKSTSLVSRNFFCRLLYSTIA